MRLAFVSLLLLATPALAYYGDHSRSGTEDHGGGPRGGGNDHGMFGGGNPTALRMGTISRGGGTSGCECANGGRGGGTATGNNGMRGGGVSFEYIFPSLPDEYRSGVVPIAFSDMSRDGTEDHGRGSGPGDGPDGFGVPRTAVQKTRSEMSHDNGSDTTATRDVGGRSVGPGGTIGSI